MRVIGTALVGALVACSDEPVGARIDAGFDATVSHAKPFTCALAPPRENSPCTLAGTACEYGTSSDATCNSQIVCTSAPGLGLYWHETLGRSCTCPASVVEGAACSGDLQCPGAGGVCGCDGTRWVCVATTEGCPPGRPRGGQPCVAEQTCDYCVPVRGARMRCTEEVWQREECP